MHFLSSSRPFLLVALSLALITPKLRGAEASPSTKQPDYSVTWTALGNDHRDSMPVGNGDIGANVWTGPNGDILLLIAKTDAWSENGQLLKIGQVRLRLSPNPFVNAPGFQQKLDVQAGRILLVSGDGVSVNLWIDANNPVIHIEYSSPRPLTLEASVELWRTRQRTISASSAEAKSSLREIAVPLDAMIQFDPDTVLPAQSNILRWAHVNERSVYPLTLENQHLQSLLAKYPDPLLDRVFGALIKGPNLVSTSDKTLRSARPMKTGRTYIYVLTEHPSTLAGWDRDINQLAARGDSIPLERARSQHERWWRSFWARSWINVSGEKDAGTVTQGYAMERWMLACAGRGDAAMKFNGSIFTIGDVTGAGDFTGTPNDPAKPQLTPDDRPWGSNYWFQNQRHLYWPLIASGDFDLLKPFFAMYRNDLPLELDRNRLYFHHDGASYPETMYFWGTPSNNDFGWNNPDVVMTNPYIRNHIDGGIELTMMMLDAWDFTQDEAYARQTMLPIAEAVTTYFDRHWKRVDGKIRFDPSQSLETDRPSVNPAPDVDGLHAILPRLIALPTSLTTAAERDQWRRTLTDLPPIPRGRTNKAGQHPEPETNADPNGKEILWTAERWTPGPGVKPSNSENPELYAVFPYRLFGVGLPELQLARDTFAARRHRDMTCWTQNGMDAADLGLAGEARRNVVANFTDYGLERFRWFWAKGNDAEPDMDNGGAGMTALQLMLLQVRGDKILLFPAWPKDWNVEFKLHAPRNTTIEGSYREGHLQRLHVEPASRSRDVIQMQPQ